MHFNALDVETANADMSSICQIGVAKYADGGLVSEWKTYVDPDDYFDGINVSIHGIDENTVKGAPKFSSVAAKLRTELDSSIVVCHTHFDRVALQQAAGRHNVVLPTCTWLDSARVARRAWKQFARKGYGLHNVCRVLGYHFTHHDALEDAKAAGYILLSAIRESGLGVNEWLARVQQPISPDLKETSVTSAANPDGFLYGEVAVFTGALRMPRREAANLAGSLGCRVTSSCTKKTTMLIVGDQDVKRLGCHEKSTKHRAAEELIRDGVPIRILRESDFMELVRLATESSNTTTHKSH